MFFCAVSGISGYRNRYQNEWFIWQDEDDPSLFRLKSIYSSKYLKAGSDGSLTVTGFADDKSQLWKIEESGDSWKITNAGSGGLLTMDSSGRASCAAAGDAAAQTWELPWVNPDYPVPEPKPVDTGRAIITAETCPHYFTLTDDAVTMFDANTKVNPPLREQADVDAIRQGLADGTLDCIVTDHAPHHADEKNVEYNLAAFGISGIETSFSLSYTALVCGGLLTIEQLAEKMSASPARILGLEGGALKEGAVADLMLADLNEKYIIDPADFVSKGKNTPFGGKEAYGRVKYTIVDGDVKFGK